MSALYLYGITRPREIPSRLADQGVELLESGTVAAIVAEFEDTTAQPTRKSLLAHADIVESLHEGEVVLPARFGIVLPDRDACVEFLDAFRDDLVAELERLGETAEMSLRGSYDEELFAEIGAHLGGLRKAYRAAPTVENGMALGEAVAAALDRRRAHDANRILEVLSPLALDVRAGELHDERGVLNIAFLVERRRVDELSERLEGLSKELSPPARFTLTGPLPPYSFVRLEVPTWVS